MQLCVRRKGGRDSFLFCGLASLPPKASGDGSIVGAITRLCAESQQ
jgi:hypothetical protein